VADRAGRITHGYGDLASGRLDDDVNLYAYVNNDPLNRSDPDGQYGRGTGFSDNEWKKFDRLQKDVAKSMDKRADSLQKKADKLDAKGKPGGDRLHAAASNLREGAKALNSNGSDGRVANAVSSADYQAAGGTKNGAAFAKGDQMTVNKGNSNAWGGHDDVTVKWVLGHESLHTGAHLSDEGFNNVKSYAFGEPEERRMFQLMRGTLDGSYKPDNLMDLVLPGVAPPN
jgi:hypothetical protein